MKGRAATDWSDLYAEGEVGLWFKSRDKTPGRPERDVWLTRPPCGHVGHLNEEGHAVDDHDDGTISVSPSIWCQAAPPNGGPCWHGFLERGVWRPA